MAKISVIVPVHNIESYIIDTLESIKASDFKDFECIIVENGSTDSTLQKAKEFCNDNPQFKVYSASKKGVSAARNFGIDKAQGDYIAFIDGDDKISQNFLWELYKGVSQGVDIAISDYRFLYHDGSLGSSKGDYSQRILKADEKQHAFFVGACWSKLINLDLIKKNNIRFKEEYHNGEDILFSAEVLAAAEAVVFCPKAVYFYRQGREGQISSRKKSLKDLQSYFYAHLDILDAVKKYPQGKALIPYAENRAASLIVGETFSASPLRHLNKDEFNSLVIPAKDRLLNICLDEASSPLWQIKWYGRFKYWFKRNKGCEFVKLMRLYRNLILQPFGIKIK